MERFTIDVLDDWGNVVTTQSVTCESVEHAKRIAKRMAFEQEEPMAVIDWNIVVYNNAY